MKGCLSILYRFGGRIPIIPYRLTEGSLWIIHRFGERAVIFPFKFDGGLGFDEEVLIYEDGDGHTTHALLSDEAEARLMAVLSVTHLNAA